jgi:CSLREA domain-containing protein
VAVTRIVAGLAAIGAAAALPLGAGAAPARSLSSTITVNSLADTVAANGLCTLREAIQNHNAKSQANADCAKGQSNNFIVFSVGGTIALAGELPAVQRKLTIDGGGAITIDGGSATRIMETADDANLRLRNVTLAHGAATGDGGGVLNANATLTLQNTVFSHNTATGFGGGVYSPGGSTKVISSVFDHNSAASAGGLGGIDVTIRDSVFNVNHASQYGGGLYTFILSMTDSVVVSNTADVAFGGLATGGRGKIEDSTVAFNTAPQGAGVTIQQAGATRFRLNTDVIIGNQAGCPGGGLVTFFSDSESSVTLRNSTISGNSTTSGSCGLGGGGILNTGPGGGTLTVSNSTIANNSSASGAGGGIYNSGVLTLLNVTVSGNSVGGASGTGGIYASSGGGFGLTTLGNTIVAENTDGNDADCGGTGAFDSMDHNIAGDGTCNLIEAHDQPSTDPDLGPLQPNGGPTQTMKPDPGSPAVDAAGDAICKARPVSRRDQRGIKRPQGSACDIGAVELVP